VLWRLGGKKSDFEMGPGTTFWWQHDARSHDDGTITLYDDGSAPPHEKESRGIRLRLDTGAKTATLVAADKLPGLLAGSQGNMQVLAGGDALVGWGAIPRVTEFDPNGKVVFDATFPDGEDSYRAYRFPWSATPATRPALATAKDKGDTKTIYASWNGATGVAAWQVLAGDTLERMQPVGGPQRSTGFETTLHADTTAPFVAVEALDADGEVLGTSATVPADAGLAAG
jgi:hypothetical protein